MPVWRVRLGKCSNSNSAPSAPRAGHFWDIQLASSESPETHLEAIGPGPVGELQALQGTEAEATHVGGIKRPLEPTLQPPGREALIIKETQKKKTMTTNQ